MSALAFDIGSYTIKAVSGKPGSSVKVVRTVEVLNSLMSAVPTDDIQVEKLTTILDTLISDNKLPIHDVRLSLPENVISTKVIEMPSLTDAELASAIGWQAEQYIPIPPEELALEYQVLYRPPKNVVQPMRVLLIGARKQVVERYVGMFGLLGIEPTILETQLISVIRSLQFKTDDETTLVAHIGAGTMIIGVVHQGELAFVFNHMIGGAMLSRSLQQGLGLDAEQSELYKKRYGIDQMQFEGKVANVLQPAVKVIADEIVKAVRFFANQHPNQLVQRVLLSGGTAQLPGLVEVITQYVGLEVLVAAPFASSTGDIPQNNHPAMSVCMGLLMREF